jgi:hypothetical protein
MTFETVGRAVAQAVSRRPLAAEARLQFQAIEYGICGGQNSAGTDFPPSTSLASFTVIF